MWVRKIGKNGNSSTVSLPTAVTSLLEWRRGDHLAMYLDDNNSLILTKFDPLMRPDLVQSAREDLHVGTEEEPAIQV